MAVELRILGLLEVTDGLRTIEIRGTKLRTLLAVLALRVNEVVSTDALVESLWADEVPASAGNTLQGYISQLRKALGPNYIVTRAPGYLLNMPEEAIDAVRFERMVKAGEGARAQDDAANAATILTKALGLWRGEPLADFTFDSFAQLDIARLQEMRLVAVEQLTQAELDLGRHADVVGRLQTLVEQYPLRERLWAQLVIALYRSGRQAEALRVLADIRRRLGEELGIEPGIELRSLEEDVLLQRPELDWRPPTTSVAEPGTNLPAPRSSFVGRDDELEEVSKLVGQRGLVSIVGPAGVGKTRLALEIARRVRLRFPDGTWVIELAPVAEPAMVPQAVAQVLEVREEPGRSLLDTLARRVAGSRQLLVVDNCEHLVHAAASAIDALLANAPSLTILATSREPLRVPGEKVYGLPPLALPERDDLGAEALRANDAVRLFCDRASGQSPFSLTTENASTVSALCRRLDGIPLAIELAAARVRALTPAQMLSRLDNRFSFLTSGVRTALPRHQTLRAALDWSHDLLESAERSLFRRLAVFVGSFGLDAIAAVCTDPDVVKESEVVDLVSSLVDHSLVQPLETDGEHRYRLLETLRAYAGERLVESGEEHEVNRTHLAWAIAFAESFADALDPRRLTDKLAMERMGAENDNLWKALSWALTADPPAALRLTVAAGRFWNIRGFIDVGRHWTDLALAAGTEAPLEIRAQALEWAAVLAAKAGDMGEALPIAEKALDAFRQLGDSHGEAYTLGILSWIADEHLGDHNRADRLLREQLAIWAKDEDDHLYCEKAGRLAVNTLLRGDTGEAYRLRDEAAGYNVRHVDDPCPEILETEAQFRFLEGDVERARDLFEEALENNRNVGRLSTAARILGWLGAIALVVGDPAEAGRCFREELKAGQEMGIRREMEQALWGLARVAAYDGDAISARSALGEAVRMTRASGRTITADDLEFAAEVLVAERHLEAAARVLGAAEALRHRDRMPVPTVFQLHHRRVVSSISADLPGAAVELAWNEGRQLSPQGALALALEAGRPDRTATQVRG